MTARFISFVSKVLLLLTVCLTPLFLFTKPWGWYVFCVVMITLIAWCLRIIFDSKLTKRQKIDRLFGTAY
nr:MAG TPA: Vpu protein [Bacteriophage sp.]